VPVLILIAITIYYYLASERKFFTLHMHTPQLHILHILGRLMLTIDILESKQAKRGTLATVGGD
jgi:hypothetical protein